MMEMLGGNPFMLVGISGIITALLVFMYFQTNDVRLRPFIAVALVLTFLPLATDFLITTQRESIKGTVQRLARSVRLNDLETTLEYAHPDSELVYQKIKQEMPIYNFSLCNVVGFHKIELSEDSKDAVVKFTVFVNVDAKRGPEGVGNRGVTLKMRQTDNGEWKIMDYKHYPPIKRNTKSSDLDTELERF